MRPRLTLREPVTIALEALRAHKLRSFLTLLGVIISVTTLIAVISVIEGMNRYIADRVANMGSNVFLITRFPIITDTQEFFKAARRNRNITWEDFEAVRDGMRLAKAVGLEVRLYGSARYGTRDLNDVNIRGVTANIAEMDVEEVSAGRYISDSDDQHRSMTAVIGADVADQLFPGMDPVGKTILVNSRPFEVVGLAKRIGTVFGQSQDNFVYIPVQTFLKIYGTSRSLTINVQCSGPELMSKTQEEARWIMRGRRHLRPNDPDSFGIIASASVMDLWHQLTDAIARTTVGIVSIFLVVGGIVIMNIMLASVTERTREIGIRKSVGARKRDILLQFLVESSVLSAVGGAIGVTLAYMISWLVAATTSVPTKVPPAAVFLALFVSTSVGLFFGMYPARKAARLDPIEALRFEV